MQRLHFYHTTTQFTWPLSLFSLPIPSLNWAIASITFIKVQVTAKLIFRLQFLQALTTPLPHLPLPWKLSSSHRFKKFFLKKELHEGSLSSRLSSPQSFTQNLLHIHTVKERFSGHCCFKKFLFGPNLSLIQFLQHIHGKSMMEQEVHFHF